MRRSSLVGVLTGIMFLVFAADQNMRDHAALLDAMTTRRVHVQPDV